MVRVFVPHDAHDALAVDGGTTVNSLARCADHAAGTDEIPRTLALRLGAASQGRVELEVDLPVAGETSIGVYDVTGRRIAVIDEGFREAGRHSLGWSLAGIPSGWYLVRLKTAAGTAARAWPLIR